MKFNKFFFPAALCSAAFLAGCGGGGGGGLGGSPPVGSIPPPGPGLTSMNTLTSYTVYAGQLNGAMSIEVAPIGDASAVSQLGGATPLAGAVVLYPDGSTQTSDVLGNFDAAQSSWSIANESAIIANPNLEPNVIVYGPQGSNDVPVAAAVQVYAPGGSIVTASGIRRTQSGSISTMASSTPELTGVIVFPRGVAMFDNESRTFHAVGTDSDGSLFGLSGSTVTWSLTLPSGCAGRPAGKLVAVAGDAAKIQYTPPTSGTFPFGCQDVVVASVSVAAATAGTPASTFSGSGNAFYYDGSQGVALSGVLNDSLNKPVAHGLVDLYGGGKEFYHGNLYAMADANGLYARFVPPNRTLYPVGGNPVTTSGKTSYTFFSVTPSSFAAGAPNTKQTQNLAETTAIAVNPFKPLPPVEKSIRDSWFAGRIGADRFPFGSPRADGTFQSGSLEAIINASATPNAQGTITAGPYSGWTYKWDATAKVVVFQEPSTMQGGRHVMQITAGAQYNGAACPAARTCFAYVAYYNLAGMPSNQPSPVTPSSLSNGTILDLDGGFAQAASASSFTVDLIRNIYSVGHQTPGKPLYSDTIAYQQTPGSATASVTDTTRNDSGRQLAVLTVSRVAGTGNTLFTYTGSVTRNSYKSDGSTTAVTYTITNGIANKDGSGGFKVTLTATPSTADLGSSVTWNLTGNTPGATQRANGTVDNPNVTGLQTGHVASFVLGLDRTVTVTMDPNLGGNVITFHL